MPSPPPDIPTIKAGNNIVWQRMRFHRSVQGRSYRSRHAADDPVRELGHVIGRLIVAARLRNALPPRRTTYAERVEIARELRRGVR